MNLKKLQLVFAGILILWGNEIAAFTAVSAFSLPPIKSTNRAQPANGNIAKVTSLISRSRLSPQTFTLFAKSDDEDGDESEELLSDSDQDWRTFRAKLVMSEKPSSSSPTTATSPSKDDSGEVIVDDSDLDGIGALFSDSTASTSEGAESTSFSGFTPLDPSQWAYDSGNVIEQGAVILGGVEQDFGFGLRQQYFHKAVILVLDHDEKTFTKGIILNRPSDRMMDDDVNEGVKWRVWYGGDVQGLDSILPDIVCLHSLKSEEARNCSVPVMKDIQWTSFSNAKKLVQRGFASGPEDFWLFAGYAGWGPNQLSGELDRKSWYMCATDSQTLLKELARQSSGVDPRDAGLDTWELLMSMIGRGETVKKSSGSFDDLILKEWGRANLLVMGEGYGGEAGIVTNPLWGTSGGMGTSGSADSVMKESADLEISGDISEGLLLRASSADRSPFLLQKQEFHKSLVLVILEDEKVSVGVMLNHAATKGYSTVPFRYGGDYAVKGQSALLWLHCHQRLRDLGVGIPLGNNKGGIYKCSQEQATEAISNNIAEASDFMVVSGVCAWPKLGGSLGTEIKKGMFEIVPETKVEEVFKTLQKQKILTSSNLSENIKLAQKAWETGASEKTSTSQKISGVLTVGIGEGFDEDDESLVFNSDTKVSELADEALRKWVATCLLGNPSL